MSPDSAVVNDFELPFFPDPQLHIQNSKSDSHSSRAATLLGHFRKSPELIVRFPPASCLLVFRRLASNNVVKTAVEYRVYVGLGGHRGEKLRSKRSSLSVLLMVASNQVEEIENELKLVDRFPDGDTQKADKFQRNEIRTELPLRVFQTRRCKQYHSSRIVLPWLTFIRSDLYS